MRRTCIASPGIAFTLSLSLRYALFIYTDLSMSSISLYISEWIYFCVLFANMRAIFVYVSFCILQFDFMRLLLSVPATLERNSRDSFDCFTKNRRKTNRMCEQRKHQMKLAKTTKAQTKTETRTNNKGQRGREWGGG